MLWRMDIVRARLVSVIAFALTRCKAQLRTMAQTHNTDEARRTAAELIADHVLARGGLDIRPRPPSTDGGGMGSPYRPER